jgi:hypothetical protein
VAVATSGTCETGVCTGRPECGSAEVVVPEAPVVPRVEVTCRASTPESGECEAAGFLTTAAAARVLEAGTPPDLGRRVTRRRVKKLRDGSAFLRLKLNPLGRRLLKKFGRQGVPLSVTIVVSVRTETGRADIRQLVQLRKLRGH